MPDGIVCSISSLRSRRSTCILQRRTCQSRRGNLMIYSRSAFTHRRCQDVSQGAQAGGCRRASPRSHHSSTCWWHELVQLACSFNPAGIYFVGFGCLEEGEGGEQFGVCLGRDCEQRRQEATREDRGLSSGVSGKTTRPISSDASGWHLVTSPEY